MAVATAYNIEQKLQEWRINGFTVFEDLIPIATIDRIREAWLPVRDAGVREQGDTPARGTRRYNVRVPFRRPFVDPTIFEHPPLVDFIGRVLGNDYIWSHFDSNVPMPGCHDFQRWHRDCPLLFPGVMTPAFQIGVKFPLVDTNPENGSFEVLPGTQYVSDADLQNDCDRIFGPGTDSVGLYNPMRLNLKRGSVWIQDGRAFHRGTPNLSNEPRDELCMGMCKSWLFSRWQHENTEKHFPRDLWEDLPEHARKVLRWQRVAD